MAVPIRRPVLFAAVAAILLASACGEPLHQPSAAQTDNGVTGYLGVVPDAVVRAEHPQPRLHPSAPIGNAHIVVALYDAASGERIEQASVEAVIRGERHRAAHRIRLEEMEIDGAVTYGGFVSLARNDRYHVSVVVIPAGSTEEARLPFVVDARILPQAGS